MNFHSRLAQPFQHKKPAREVWIDDDVLAADLEKKTGMANESHAHLAICDQNRLMGFSDSGSHGRAPYELPKLSGAFAHRRTFEGLSQHRGRWWFSLARQ